MSIGDHIRARRIELRLLQKQVALRFGATVPSVLNWEKNRSEPSLRFLPKIIEFLGDDPKAYRQPQSIGEQIKTHRRKLGLSRKKLADLLGIDPSNLAGWEMAKHRPTKNSMDHVVKEFFLWTTIPER